MTEPPFPGAEMVPLLGVEAPDLRRDARDLLREVRSGRLGMILDMDATPATYDAVELIAEHYARVLLVKPRDEIARDTPLLVAQGMTNVQIAAKLGISHRTVESHVHNVKAALDLSTRAQLVTWAQSAGTSN